MLEISRHLSPQSLAAPGAYAGRSKHRGAFNGLRKKVVELYDKQFGALLGVVADIAIVMIISARGISMPALPGSNSGIIMSRKRRIRFIAEALTRAHVARSSALAAMLDPDRFEPCLACDPRYNHLLSSLPFARREIASIPAQRSFAAVARGAPNYDGATLIAEAGAGCLLRADRASVDEIRSAARLCLASEAIRAQALRSAIDRRDTAAIFAKVLDSLLQPRLE